jgi:hypothetical protein
MKSQIFLLAVIAAVFSSCSSAYKTGQTPDDVYYSPGRQQDEYVQVEKNDDRRYQSVDEYYDERFLRMRVQNRYRWSTLDEFYFNGSYHPYSYYGFSNHWNNPWNNYWTWNNYYNPYCYGGVGGGIIIKNPTAYVRPPSKPIAFSSNSYLGNNNGSRVKNSGYSNNYYNGGTRYNNSNSGNNGRSSSTYSNSNSRSNDNSYSSPGNSTPSRSYTPSSSSSSSSSSSGSRPSSSGSSSSGGSSSGGSSRPPR